MSEIQKMLLLICFFTSICVLFMFYIFQEYGLLFEMCIGSGRSIECKIYRAKIVRDLE